MQTDCTFERERKSEKRRETVLSINSFAWFESYAVSENLSGRN